MWFEQIVSSGESDVSSLTPPSPPSGPGEEPPDVRGARGGGGAEGADQGADRAQHTAGAREQPAEEPGQPRADGPVPGSGPDRLPHRPRAAPPGRDPAAAPPPHTELRHICVTVNQCRAPKGSEMRGGRGAVGGGRSLAIL